MAKKNPNADMPHTFLWYGDAPHDIKLRKATFDRCVHPQHDNGWRTTRRASGYMFVHPKHPDLVWAVCHSTKAQNTPYPDEIKSRWVCVHVASGCSIKLANKLSSRRDAAFRLWNWAGKKTREEIDANIAAKLANRAALILSLPI